MRTICFFLFLSTIIVSFSTAQEKKKGFFSKIADSFKPVPGEINASNVDNFFQAFSNPSTSDPEMVALLNDTALHVVFGARLGVYDNENEGFPVIIERHELPYLKGKSATYRFLLTNINNYRFFKISKEQVKEKFNIIPFDLKFDVNRELQGNRDLALKLYFSPDTVLETKKGERLIAGTISKMDVVLLRDDGKHKGEVVNSSGPFIPGDNISQRYANLEDTQLYKYLEKYPFYSDEDWPRVSITFTHFPEIYKKTVIQDQISKSIIAGDGSGNAIHFQDFGPCYLTATIWESKTKKIEIPEFSWFPYDFDTYGIPTADLSTWGIGSASSTLKENTGYKRTVGPVPPQHPFPQTPYADKSYLEYSTAGTMVIADILNKIGYDWNRVGDRRVWFNIQ